MKIWRTTKTLQTTVQGTTITITPKLIGEILDIPIKGLVLRKRNDPLKQEIGYKATFALPKEYTGEKVLIFIEYHNRNLHYALGTSLLHKANTPNSVSNTEHCIMQYMENHKPINFPLIIIHHISKHI